MKKSEDKNKIKPNKEKIDSEKAEFDKWAKGEVDKTFGLGNNEDLMESMGLPYRIIGPTGNRINPKLLPRTKEDGMLGEILRRLPPVTGSDNIKSKYKDWILYFKNKELDFTNKQNQKYLLATLFKEPERSWSYDEVQHDWDETDEDKFLSKDWWKKFYSAGDGINTVVAKKTQIEDFIIKNTKEIRINPKYV